MASEPLLLTTLSGSPDDQQGAGDEEQVLHHESPNSPAELEDGDLYDFTKPAWSRRRTSMCSMKVALSSLALVLILISLWLLIYELRPRSEHHPGVKHFVVFGDSYSKINFKPEGAMPSTANPVGNPETPQSATSSGGMNWALILGTEHNKTMTYIYDFASGGATIEEDLITPPHNLSRDDFGDQFELFNKVLQRSDGPGLDAAQDAIVAVWFGQNDVDQVYNRTFEYPNVTFDSANATFDATFDVYFKWVGELWELGTRDFIFIGVAPILRSPMVQLEQDPTEVDRLSQAFNERLASRAKQFAHARKGTKWHYYDPAPAFNRVLDNPKAYQLEESNCFNKDGISCAWWDHFHPGVRIHEQVALDIAGIGSSAFDRPAKRPG